MKSNYSLARTPEKKRLRASDPNSHRIPLFSYVCSARSLRVTAALRAAARLIRVLAAFRPAALRLRVIAAFRPAALSRRVLAAF